MDELYIGLMSGTSNDGVDAALVNLTDGFHCLETHHEPYPEEIHRKLQQLVSDKSASFSDLLRQDQEVAVVHALAVRKLLNKAHTTASHIVAIGFHGQTLYHQPSSDFPNTLQIGNPAFLAQHTGITTVADFRRRDMAAGGQGAPFAPAFHEFLFRDNSISRAAVNIGGIANITILPADSRQPVSGFDTGPGNGLMDEWIQRHKIVRYDKKGEWARSGQVDKKLLEVLLADEYFALPPPKSTGREYFNLRWLARKFNPELVAAEDLQATLLELTSASITKAVLEHASDCREIYICGGGANNDYLMETLTQSLQDRKVLTTAQIGLGPDWVEACAFAWFAHQTIHKKPLRLSSITGAKQDVIAGAIYQ